MAGGRPTDYRPEYCERVIELGRDGCSIVEMCAELDVDRSTLERAWPEQFPEFSQALARARAFSQAWWEKQGREGVWESQGGPKINAGLYSRSMAARFPHDWRESNKTEISGPNGGPIESSIKVEFLAPGEVDAKG